STETRRREQADVRVLSVNSRRLLPTATKSAPATSRNFRKLPTRLGRCHCLRLVLSRLRLPVPPPRRGGRLGTYGHRGGWCNDAFEPRIGSRRYISSFSTLTFFPLGTCWRGTGPIPRLVAKPSHVRGR